MAQRTKHLQIPATRSADIQQQKFNDAVRQQLNMLGGTKLDRALTVRDVVGGVLKGIKLTGAVLDAEAQPGSGGPDADAPTVPTNVQGFAGVDVTFLTWDRPTFRGYAYTEIYRFDADSLALAQRVATSAQPAYSEYVGYGQTLYYWVRHVSKAGSASAFHATAGIRLQTKPDYEAIQDALSEQINESYLAQTLRARIDLIDVSNNGGLVAAQQQLATDLQSAKDLLQGQINSQGTSIVQLQQADTTQAQQLSALTLRTDNLDATVLQLDTVSSGHASRLTQLELVSGQQANSITSLQFVTTDQAGRLSTLESDNGSNKSKITTLETTTAGHASRLGTLEADNGTSKSRLTSLETADATQASRIEQLSFTQDPLPRSALYSEETWVIGSSGSQPGFIQNASTGVINSIVSGTGPYGTSTKLWKATAGTGNGADGGWNGQSFTVDSTKRYRFSVWIRGAEGNTGTVYLGCSGTVQSLSGVADTNPYFYSGTVHRSAEYVDRWLLVVGVVHPAGTSVGLGIAGIYDPVTAERISAGTEFRFVAGDADIYHRAYQYYAQGNTNSVLYFAHPRVDRMDGSEPSLADLMRSPVVGAVADTARAYTDTKTGEIKAERTIKVQADGRVAGIGLIAGATSGSAIYFSAEKLAILPPSANNVLGARLPFIYDAATGAIMMDTTFIRDLTASKIAGGVLNLTQGNIRNLTVFDSFSPPDQFLQKAHFSDSLARELAWIDPNAVATGGTVSKNVSPTIATTTMGSFLSGGQAPTVKVSGAAPTYQMTYAASGYIDVQILRNNVAVTVDGKTTFRILVSSALATDEALPAEQRRYMAYCSGGVEGVAAAVANNTTTNWSIKIVATSGLGAHAADFVVKGTAFEAFGTSGGLIANTTWDAVQDKPATATRWPSFSEVTGEATITGAFSSDIGTVAARLIASDGVIIDVSDTLGGWARGLAVRARSTGTRLAGAGFYGSNTVAQSYHVGFSSSWWGSSAFELSPSTAIFRTALLANRLSAGWDSGVTGSVSCSNWFRSTGATGWYNTTYGGGINMEDTIWVRVYGNKKFYVENSEVNALNTSGGVSGLYLGVANTLSTSGNGLSLYGGPVIGQPTYGIMFAGTAAFGNHGAVTSDWATYLTMNTGATTRGWIFKAGAGTSGNVASISGGGYLTLNAGVEAGAGYVRNNVGSSWISQKDSALVGLYNDTAVSTSNYAAVVRQKHASHTYTIGGLGNSYFGIFSFLNGRTANGTDGSFYMDVYGNCTASGTVTAADHIYSSDNRLKRDQKPILNAVAKLHQLAGKTYYRTDIQKYSAGVIAQDVQRILPEAVTQDENGYLAVSPGALIGLLVEAVKELSTKVQQLEAAR